MTRPAILVARAIYPETLERLRAVFEVEDNPSDEILSPPELLQRLRGKQGALTTGSERVGDDLLAALPELKVVANLAVGYNNFDIEAFNRHGVIATNTPDVLTETTADFGFGLMLSAARRMAESEHALRRGEWKRWRFDMFCGQDVHGATLGILGMGRIGQGIAKRGALGFGMKVIYHNRRPLDPSVAEPLGATYVDKETLFRQADHIVLVLPYSPENHHAVSARELHWMKPTATLTNVARGGIVDDVALAQALSERRIAAAGLDVFEGEPALHPGLLTVPNVVLTPHIASASDRTRRAMSDLAADNLIAVLTGGAPLTPVNPDVWSRRRT